MKQLKQIIYDEFMAASPDDYYKEIHAEEHADNIIERFKSEQAQPQKQQGMTMPIIQASGIIQSMPLGQAIQQIKSKITGQPETVKIEGDLYVGIPTPALPDEGWKREDYLLNLFLSNSTGTDLLGQSVLSFTEFKTILTKLNKKR